MIAYSFTKSINKYIIETIGHAEKIKRGDVSLVCCAVSTIVQVCFCGCEMCGNARLICQKNGHFKFSVEQDDSIHNILFTALVGLRQLKEQYPDKITEMEVCKEVERCKKFTK